MDRFFNNPLKRSSDLTSVEKKQKTDVSQTNDEQSTDVSRNMESLLNSSSIEFHRNIATKISEQIKEDKHECCSLISKYGIDSNELLHLLGEWTQDLIMKYKQNREQLKGLLQDKWERGELPNIKSDDDSNRLVYEHIRNLNEWQRTGLANIKQQFSEVPTTEHVRDKTNRLIKELLKTMSSIIFVQQNLTNCNSDDRSRIDTSLHSLRTTEEQIKRMQKLNEKEYNTICIIGLEKAGKSSFINALLGFEILPFKIERCTQIQTIVKPILKEDPKLFATIEFYNRDEYLLLMEQLPKNNNETNVAFDKRQKLIDQKREESIPSDILHEDYRVSGESERRKVIKKLHMYITDDTYLSIVRHVVFYTDKLPGENYILVDVPGCDSPIAEHRASAIKAVKNADAFLFLTDGQRPSLTDHQIRLLNEIQVGHFDGMKRAFGIITKLDLCPTQVKYQEHLVKARCELEQKGFRPDHIFTVASNVVLLEETKSNPKELNQSKARLNHYGSLLDGFHQCKQKLNNFIECELPRSRFGQIVTIAEEKISHNVENTLKLCQQSILMGIDEISLDEYIKRLHRNEWNEIFENKCYQPVLARAVRWQKETLILKKTECIEALIVCFHEQFRTCTQHIIAKTHSIEQAMLEQHDIAVFQMNSSAVDAKERATIVCNLLQAVKTASDKLATWMYHNYIDELKNILKDVCLEQVHCFQGDPTIERCSTEVKTLILRVANPLIMATIRWPHDLNDCRLEAVKELTRVAPIIVFNIYQNNQSVAAIHDSGNLGKIVIQMLSTLPGATTPIDRLNSLFRRLD